jgi:thiosulfate/3-mercaptopyruvate sulfurtransferase
VLAARASVLDGRHPLPEPDAFATGLSTLGVGDGDTVIAYDDAGGVIAARLVWMLRSLGHPAALLDGGLAAWSGKLETGSSPRPPSQFTPRPWPAALIVSIDDVAGSTDVLIDGRDLVRYRGGPDPVDPRSGHIPGALSLPARENNGEYGRLLGIEQLRERFASAGIRARTPVISYCGSGVTACHNLLALEHAGLGTGRLYPGSWSQWSRDSARPVATGDSA